MTLLQSILMGLIQGLTEFLPVSSSGHLALFKILFKMNTEMGILFDVLLHIATLAAVCLVYWRDVVKLIKGLILLIIDVVYNITVLFRRKRQPDLEYHKLDTSRYKKFMILIIITMIPTGIIGVCAQNAINAANEILLIPGICLLITALLLLLSDRMPKGRKGVKSATLTDAFIIGIFQGCATMPGISRSGSTIAACCFLGFDRKFAVKYSFLASIPAILAAMVLEIKDIGGATITRSMAGSYVVGMIIAAVVGFIMVKLMLRIVTQRKFKYFSIYCAAVGIVSIIGYCAM